MPIGSCGGVTLERLRRQLFGAAMPPVAGRAIAGRDDAGSVYSGLHEHLDVRLADAGEVDTSLHLSHDGSLAAELRVALLLDCKHEAQPRCCARLDRLVSDGSATPASR
jgi:hypothetical protein